MSVPRSTAPCTDKSFNDTMKCFTEEAGRLIKEKCQPDCIPFLFSPYVQNVKICEDKEKALEVIKGTQKIFRMYINPHFAGADKDSSLSLSQFEPGNSSGLPLRLSHFLVRCHTLAINCKCVHWVIKPIISYPMVHGWRRSGYYGILRQNGC